jgi:3alpha(or 20beta)-hydroxysteroid dehydrogenase
MSGGRFSAKVALVTGAARGTGAETARRFAAEGARVLVADVLEAEGALVAKEIGAAARFVALDVTDESAWRAAVATAEREWGRLDVLVNNAGVAQPKSVLECSGAEFRRVLEVNLVGPFLGMHVAAPLIAKGGGGAIVNVSSVQGIVGRAGLPAYTASKFGLRGLTKTAALELGALGIRVNSLHPGGVDTPLAREAAGVPITSEQLDAAHRQLPVPRVGTPADMAAAILFLASDEAAYVTGTELVVDGGLTAGSGPPPRRPRPA